MAPLLTLLLVALVGLPLAQALDCHVCSYNGENCFNPMRCPAMVTYCMTTRTLVALQCFTCREPSSLSSCVTITTCNANETMCQITVYSLETETSTSKAILDWRAQSPICPHAHPCPGLRGPPTRSAQGSNHHKTRDSSHPRALATDGQVEAQSPGGGHRHPPSAALCLPCISTAFCETIEARVLRAA